MGILRVKGEKGDLVFQTVERGFCLGERATHLKQERGSYNMLLFRQRCLRFLFPLGQISPYDPDLPHDGFTLNAEPNHPTRN